PRPKPFSVPCCFCAVNIFSKRGGGSGRGQAALTLPLAGRVDAQRGWGWRGCGFVADDFTFGPPPLTPPRKGAGKFCEAAHTCPLRREFAQSFHAGTQRSKPSARTRLFRTLRVRADAGRAGVDRL